LYYPAKFPDLIGIKDRKYTTTSDHLHKASAISCEYAALVSFRRRRRLRSLSCAVTGDETRFRARLSDEALYALAMYIYSLKPPPNPNPRDERANAGKEIFVRERCGRCHTPPLYTNNKLTLALGFTPPDDTPATLDVMEISVGTDPGLALATRKGNRVLQGPVAQGTLVSRALSARRFRRQLGGDVRSGPAAAVTRSRGWLPPGEKIHAIKGHEFGLRLTPTERDALLAFLRTL
jgi:hypothetical protein